MCGVWVLGVSHTVPPGYESPIQANYVQLASGFYRFGDLKSRSSLEIVFSKKKSGLCMGFQKKSGLDTVMSKKILGNSKVPLARG